ncbi:hypothetical protein D2E65_00055 [Mycobacteroides abscessus]|uniref:hypothetical protein n=1 Tax=Mycobacteroides abscessus TaxID=36809 RepID=UPI000E680A51|nr:hypothetical protein [Mycobacteroides abscessus]RIR80305.1 hypothetical protein D2E65_00055 [Mycobacteroides abscessus]
MIQALHSILGMLAARREQVQRDMGHRQIGVAFLEVIDELDARLRTITDGTPADATPTLQMFMHDAEHWTRSVLHMLEVLKQTGQVAREGGRAVFERWHPLTAVINRVESENYDVSAEDFTTVTDGKDWALLDTITEPEIRVQLEAEKIARAEQAKAYQQRLERMKAAIQVIENQYADRIRQLPYTTPIPPMPDVPSQPQKMLRTLPSGELVFDYEPTDTPPQT